MDEERELESLRARLAFLEREREELFSEGVNFPRALEAAGVGVWGWDAATNRAHWTPQNFRLLGLSPGSVEPSYEVWLSRVHAEDRPGAELAVRKVMEAGGQLDITFRVVHGDGSIRWINDVGRLLLERGKPIGMYGIQRDITAQVDAQRELADVHQLLQSFMDSTSDWLFAKDLEHRFLFVNRAFAAAQGRTPAEMRGRIDTEIWSLELCEGDPERGIRGLHHDDREAFAGRSVHNTRDPATVEGGAIRYSDTVKTPLRSHDGEIRGVLCYSRDITDRLAAEDARRVLEAQLLQGQKLEAVGTLAGGIAHDFNNILTIIRSHAELLLARLRADPHRSDVEAVLEAADRAANLVRQILTFSRARDPERRAVVLESLVGDAVRFLRSTIPATIDIECSLPSTTTVVADPTQIQQVIMNLATNAAHAMAGHGCLRLASDPVVVEDNRANLRPGSYVRVAVSDTGAGIPEDHVGRIFEPFFTTKGPGEGTGLGLSVVHGIMRAHEGAVNVTSAVGRGSTFELYFPIAQQAEPQLEVSIASTPKAGSGHILFVDDEPALTRVAERMLRTLGYQVTACTSAREALEQLNRAAPKSFGLLLTDLTMPAMNGLELARRARAHDADLRVVVISGDTTTLTPATIAAAGVSVLPKPFSLAQLAEELARVLR